MASSFRPKGWGFLLAGPALILLGCVALGASALAGPVVQPAPWGSELPQGAASSAPTTPYTPCGSLSFASPVTYYVGIRPRSAAGGDFNRDTHPDVVVTDYSSRTVSVLLGNPDGTFQPSVPYAVGFHPVTPAVGDLNGDQVSDLVAANYDSANVSVLLGNPDGTFQPASNYSSNIGPYGATVGDFNEDGHPDAATSNVNFGTINVMLGNGDGSLQGPTQYQAGTRPQVIATSDFNGDNHLDLVTPNYASTTVSVLPGNGDGTFRPAVTFPVESGPDFLAVADLNADTHPDLAVPHYSTNNMSVLLGNGDGTFRPEVLYPAGGPNPLFVAVGDFNGDDAPDLAAANYGGNTIGILTGTGDGTFRPAVTFAVGAGTSPVAVVPGDFNGDTRLDMFVANENTDNGSVFINTCVGGTATPTPTAPSMPSPTNTPTATRTNTPQATQTAHLPTATSTPSPPPIATGTGTGTPRPATATITATMVTTSTATATPCSISFTDVHLDDYFYEPVRYLYCHGAISGYGDNTFRPYNLTTRAQLAKIAVLAEGWTIYTPPAPTFRDVPTNDAFYGHVETAYHQGIISGYSCGMGCLEYRPGNNVTRAQLGKIVVLAEGWSIYTPPAPTFRDVPAGDPFYGFVETAYQHGIISGYGCGAGCLEFRPGNNATRGQICKIVYLAVREL